NSMRLCFGNAPAPTETYTLSLHDALPIYGSPGSRAQARGEGGAPGSPRQDAQDNRARDQNAARRRWKRRGAGEHHRSPARGGRADRKSTRLNSSHVKISYAVFCLKKKNKT